MPIALKTMTKANWETLKKNAGVKSAKWYEKAHADVGGYIDKMQKARAKYKAAKTPQSVKEYNSALVDLHKAFDKFLAAKEFKTELATQLQADVKDWQREAADKSTKLIKLYNDNLPQLQKNDVKDLFGKFDDILGDK